MQPSARFDGKHNQVDHSCHKDAHYNHDQDLDDPVVGELAGLNRTFFHEDGNTRQRSQRARNVDKRMAKVLLRPGDETHSSSAKHDQDDCVSDLKQISLAEEHRNTHAGE